MADTAMAASDVRAVLGGDRVLGRLGAGPGRLRDAVRRGLPYRAMLAVCDRLEVTPRDLALVLRLPARTLARRKQQAVFGADESDRLARVAWIAATAADALGSSDRAARWLKAPNRALGDQTPLSLLDTDAGAREVEAVLWRIEHGVFS